MKTLTVALIGAGCRGQTYTDKMKDDRFKVIAVAEPIKKQRELIKKTHNICDEMCFKNYDDLLKQPKLADIAIISTVDSMHFDPAMKAIEKGYNLLLEKPVAPTAEECVKISNFASEKGVKILVCHVLRYTQFFGKIKELINKNAIGKVMSIHHSECVGNEHQSHSYVRGNWGNTAKSSNMLLAKSCHDIDIIQWLVGSKCKNVQSFGSLSYFTNKNAPEDAPEYCIDGCPHSEECNYNAVKLYLEDDKGRWFRYAATKTNNSTDEQVKEILKTTQYGKCVFKCDNDVVDHQVVNLEFENGAVASFNMCAFNEGGRFIRVMGTEGEIYGNMETNTLDYFSFKTREHEIINPSNIKLTSSITDGHGGGDSGIVDTLYKYLTENYQGDLLSEIGISVENHLITFAAEKSRIENKVINIKEFEKENGLK